MHATWYSNADHSETCRQALILLSRRAMQEVLGLEISKKEADKASRTIEKCAPSHQPFAVGSDRLQVRLDMYVTRRANDRRPAPDAVQLDLIDRAGEHLIFYDEMPVLDYPSSATKLLPEGYEYPCDRFDDRRVIENVLDAARHPNKADLIMQRPGARRDCVVAASPAQYQDQQAAISEHERQQEEKIKVLWRRGELRDTTVL